MNDPLDLPDESLSPPPLPNRKPQQNTTAIVVAIGVVLLAILVYAQVIFPAMNKVFQKQRDEADWERYKRNQE